MSNLTQEEHDLFINFELEPEVYREKIDAENNLGWDAYCFYSAMYLLKQNNHLLQRIAAVLENTKAL